MKLKFEFIRLLVQLHFQNTGPGRDLAANPIFAISHPPLSRMSQEMLR